jgi:hypothetical protein
MWDWSVFTFGNGPWTSQQTLSSLYRWTASHRISFRVYGIPVQPEDSGGDGPGTTVTRSSHVLTDFRMDPAPPDGSDLVFAASGPLRWHSLSGGEPIMRMRVHIMYTDFTGAEHPIKIEYGQEARFMCEFRDKALGPG